MGDMVSRDELVRIIACVRARHELSQPARTFILQSQGVSALVDEIFYQDQLFNTNVDQELAHAEKVLSEWEQAGYSFVTVLDENYPCLLAGVHEAPPILFYEGNLFADDQGVSVVGSRKASPEARGAAYEVSSLLANNGITVVLVWLLELILKPIRQHLMRGVAP